MRENFEAIIAIEEDSPAAFGAAKLIAKGALDALDGEMWTELPPDIPGYYWWRPRKEIEPSVVELHEGGRFVECGDWQCPAEHGFPGEWWSQQLDAPAQARTE